MTSVASADETAYRFGAGTSPLALRLRAMNDVVRLQPSALHATATSPPGELLPDHLALQVVGIFSPDECSAWTRGVYEARGAWVADFDAQQFTLGMAWYTHLEQGKTREYFAGAAAANERVERFAPGLQTRLRALAGSLVGAPVRLRPGWCGAGVHIFPREAEVACHGGSVHYDLEGLTPAIIAARASALSLIGVLQPATEGGGLRLWDRRYDADAEEASGAEDGCGDDAAPRHDVHPDGLPPPAATLAYGPGDLAVIDSYRLHQIEPFGGPRDRVTVTAHVAKGLGGWEIWF
jgi:hypothetical protein